MSFLDFLLFFVYCFIFSFIFSLQRKNIKDAKVRVYHKMAFWYKVFFCFCYSMFVLYISIGDTTALFFPEGNFWYNTLLDDPSKLDLFFGPGTNLDQSEIGNPTFLGYYSDPSNVMVIRVTALLSFLCFGKYMAINLFFAIFAFSGLWKLYEFFLSQYPKLHRQFAIAILFLPTLTFWSSGILKDSLAIASLGWFTFSVYQLFYLKKKLITNSIIIFVSLYIFSIVKIYILVAYLPAFIIFLLLKNAMLLKNALAKFALITGFIIVSIFGFVTLTSTMQEAVVGYTGNDISEGIGSYQNNYQKQKQKADGAYFSLGVEFDGSTSSLLKIAPAAVIATFYRPFIWESRNVSTLLSSIESFVLMIFTLLVFFKVGLLKSIKTVFKQPIILYCLFFAMVFALFVGATTLNFGTLVRYKIPAMPFYVCSLFLILYHNDKIKFTKSTKLPQPKINS